MEGKIVYSFTKRYNLSVSIPYFYPDLQLEKTNRGGAGWGGWRVRGAETE